MVKNTKYIAKIGEISQFFDVPEIKILEERVENLQVSRKLIVETEQKSPQEAHKKVFKSINPLIEDILYINQEDGKCVFSYGKGFKQ